MIRSTLPLRFAFVAAFAAALAAQTTIPISPRATFYRTSSDTAVAAQAIPLSSIGVVPGHWLEIHTSGGFSHQTGYPDQNRGLYCVFSSTPTLLGDSLQHRVPGAIAAGPAFVVPMTTYWNGLPMDLGEDFVVCTQFHGNGMTVQVPAGAAYLFACVCDSLYGDNTDPNGDYAAVFTPVPDPVLPGTGEHVVLASGVGRTPTPEPEVENAPGPCTVGIEVRDPVQQITTGLWLVAADVIATGAPANTLLPRTWVGPSPLSTVLTLGVVGSPAEVLGTYTLQLPAGFAGLTIVVQAALLGSAQERNGTYESTVAHRLVM